MYQIKSKTYHKSITQFETLEEVKWWFDMICNIPSNWVVICPDGTVLQGEHYHSF